MKGTIKSKADIERLFAQGEKVNAKDLLLIVSKTPQGLGCNGRVAFVAGKKLGCAPVRNRAKRIMREVCRAAGGAVSGYDIVFVARRGVLRRSQRELTAACEEALQPFLRANDGQ